MKRIYLFSLGLFLQSCSSLTELYRSAEDIANNDCIDLTVSKDVLEDEEKDLKLTIELTKHPKNQ